MEVCEKIEAENIIKKFPDNATIEDIQYHLFIATKIKNSRKQIEQGKLYSQSEVEEKLSRWLIK